MINWSWRWQSPISEIFSRAHEGRPRTALRIIRPIRMFSLLRSYALTSCEFSRYAGGLPWCVFFRRFQIEGSTSCRERKKESSDAPSLAHLFCNREDLVIFVAREEIGKRFSFSFIDRPREFPRDGPANDFNPCCHFVLFICQLQHPLRKYSLFWLITN